uniref:CTCK domain-containing protein n=1 Tax=Biomphalaria glabrata TaxID=6526 RepID=A0A2C9K0B9_BIOGL
MAVGIDGDVSSYQVRILDGKAVLSEPIKNNNGEETFQPSSTSRNFFSANIAASSSIKIVITGPSNGFQFNISELKLCLPKLKYCTLNSEEKILTALKFLPANNVLGSTQNNKTVYYGYNGDIIEDGVVVTGSCYSCSCKEYLLVCDVAEEECAKCPEPIVQCVGDCNNAFTSVTFNEDGVPDHCFNSSVPCVPDGCSTTPHQCPGPWSGWTPCSSTCQKFRNRTCGSDCDADCVTSYNLTDSQSCDICVTVTTGPICDDNEVPACVSKYDECIESCAVYRKNSTCDSLLDDITCVDKCQCKDGYMRNAFGDCVKLTECECYKDSGSSTPIPQTYIVNISKCGYCLCNEAGYSCREREDCCEIQEWTEWSSCDVTCGTGSRSRQRKILGDSCSKSEESSESKVCQPGECPCFYNGQFWEAGKVVTDKCQECTCRNGEVKCVEILNLGNEVWPNDECTEKCYCNTNGTMECSYSQEYAECRDVIDNCDLTTNVLEDTDDACCKRCVPKMIPCTYKAESSVMLNITTEDNGLCVSVEPQEVGSCSGTCGVSSDSIVKTMFQNGRLELITAQNCACCKASIEFKSVSFNCEYNGQVQYDVSYISGCNCERCG